MTDKTKKITLWSGIVAVAAGLVAIVIGGGDSEIAIKTIEVMQKVIDAVGGVI